MITAALGKFLLRRSSNCSCTCIASSRVGTSTRASILRAAGFFVSCSMIGSKNASVLPVPV